MLCASVFPAGNGTTLEGGAAEAAAPEAAAAEAVLVEVGVVDAATAGAACCVARESAFAGEGWRAAADGAFHDATLCVGALRFASCDPSGAAGRSPFRPGTVLIAAPHAARNGPELSPQQG